MLTQIEWWGGLLIVWGALACRFMARPNDAEGRWFSVVALCAYGLMGVTFALYFYELQQPWLRYAFLVTAAAAAVCTPVLMVMFFRQNAEDDADVGEQGGAGVAFFAAAIMLTPLVVPLALVGFKSLTVLHLL